MNGYIRASKNGKFDKELSHARSLAHPFDARNFKFAVVQIEPLGTKDKSSWVSKYEVDMLPDPSEHPDFHMRYSFEGDLPSSSYPSLCAMLVHSIEQYWLEKDAQSSIPILTSHGREIILELGKHGYIPLRAPEEMLYLADPLDFYSQHISLEQHMKPVILTNDVDLWALKDIGCVMVDEFPYQRGVHLTGKGMRVLHIINR